MISIKNVSYRHKNGVVGVENINLNIADGEFVYIVGQSGGGKTTLIRLLNSEIVPDKGTILVDGINVGKLPNRKVPKYRRTIGVVFQEFDLLERKTVFENVAYALEVIDMKKEPLRQRVRECLRIVGLTDKANSLPHQLSGGQRQRVAIARAFAGKPKIIIADEPTGNLDYETAEEMLKSLERLNTEEGTTVLMVTHQAELIRKYPKRVITIKSAHIADDSPVEKISDIYKSYDDKKISDVEYTAERIIEKEVIEKKENEVSSIVELPKGEEHVN